MSKQLKLPTLLVIADNPSIRFWVKKHLDDQFFILSAEGRQEALEALSARLDFIIIDAALEDCDALALCKELSQLTQKTPISILLVTGRLKKSFRDRALASGVTDFLSDQLDLDELETRIYEGLKAALIRQKTEDLGLSIQPPKKLETRIKPTSAVRQKTKDLGLSTKISKILPKKKDSDSP
jgi:PleD family two-component response regulator